MKSLDQLPIEQHDSIYYELGRIARSKDQTKALDYIRKSYQMSLEFNHTLISEKACFGLQYFFKKMGVVDSAFFYNTEGMKYAEINQSASRMVIFSNNIGLHFRQQNIYDSALSYYFRSLEYSKLYELPYDQVIAYNNIGTIYVELQNFEEAVRYYSLALELSLNEKFEKFITLNYLNISVAYIGMKNYDGAINSLQEILSICEKLDCDLNTYNKAYYNLGYCHFERKDYVQAEKYLQLARSGAIGLNDEYILAESNALLGGLFLKKGEVSTVYSYLSEAEGYATTSTDKKLQRWVYEYMAEYHERVGNYDESLKYTKLYTSIKDSLFNETMANSIKNVLLDAKQKEAEAIISKKDEELKRTRTVGLLVGIVALLSSLVVGLLIRTRIQNIRVKKKLQSEVLNRTRDLRRRNNELAKSKREYDHLIYRTSHDIRGPLSTLQGLANLAKIEVNNGLEAGRMEEYLNNIENTAKGLTDTLSKLLVIDKVRNQEMRKDEVDLESLISRICDGYKLKEKYSHVNLAISIPVEASLVYSDKFLLELIFEQVIENAFCYQDIEKQKHIIEITVIRHNQSTKVVISDNGIGITDFDKSRIFDLFFVASENHGSGLGLFVAQKASERIGGRIVLEKVKNPTTFSIYFPTEVEEEDANWELEGNLAVV